MIANTTTTELTTNATLSTVLPAILSSSSSSPPPPKRLSTMEQFSSWLYRDANALSVILTDKERKEGVAMADSWSTNEDELGDVQIVLAAEHTEAYEFIEFARVDVESSGAYDSIGDDEDFSSENLATVRFVSEIGASVQDRAFFVNLLFAGRGPSCLFQDFLRTWLLLAPAVCIDVTRDTWHELTQTYIDLFPDSFYPQVVKIPTAPLDEAFYFGLIDENNELEESYSAVEGEKRNAVVNATAVAVDDSVVESSISLGFLDLVFDKNDHFDDSSTSENDSLTAAKVTTVAMHTSDLEESMINATQATAVGGVNMSSEAFVLQNSSLSIDNLEAESEPAITITPASASSWTLPILNGTGLYIKVPAHAIASVFLPISVLAVLLIIVFKWGKSILFAAIKA